MNDSDKPKRIDSAKNPRFRSARQLRERKGRAQQGRFLVDGIREIHRALEHGISIVEAYIAVELITTDEARSLRQELFARRVAQFELPESLWRRLAFGERTDGIIALAEVPRVPSDSIHLGDVPLVVVLDRVEKPGNIGAVSRTVDAVGASCLVLVDCPADLFNPNTIRASVGTIFRVPVLQMSSEQAIRWIRQHGLQTQIARVDSRTSCFDVDFRGPTAMVLGSEAQGVSSAWSTDNPSDFHIPMLGHGDSLNVSITAAVALYEAFRQRRGISAPRP